MAEFKLIPIPAEDCDALGINADTVLETYITDDKALVIRVVDDDALCDLICGNDCECCPLGYYDNGQDSSVYDKIGGTAE